MEINHMEGREHTKLIRFLDYREIYYCYAGIKNIRKEGVCKRPADDLHVIYATTKGIMAFDN